MELINHSTTFTTTDLSDLFRNPSSCFVSNESRLSRNAPAASVCISSNAASMMHHLLPEACAPNPRHTLTLKPHGSPGYTVQPRLNTPDNLALRIYGSSV